MGPLLSFFLFNIQDQNYLFIGGYQYVKCLELLSLEDGVGGQNQDLMKIKEMNEDDDDSLQSGNSSESEEEIDDRVDEMKYSNFNNTFLNISEVTCISAIEVGTKSYLAFSSRVKNGCFILNLNIFKGNFLIKLI
jgi:hypothetical protein